MFASQTGRSPDEQGPAQQALGKPVQSPPCLTLDLHLEKYQDDMMNVNTFKLCHLINSDVNIIPDSA